MITNKKEFNFINKSYHVLLNNGVFIGRFQPIHLGHLETIKFALTHVSELTIVIGSAQKSHELKNPFTSGERIEMIRSSIKELKLSIERVILIPVPDVDIHYLWTYNLDLLIPKYQVVFTNDPFTSILFSERGTKVIQPPLIKRTYLSATEVRNRIVNDRDWKKLVTPSTYKIIKKIDGTKRLKALNLKYQEKHDSH